jgi:hypothetical protein
MVADEVGWHAGCFSSCSTKPGLGWRRLGGSSPLALCGLQGGRDDSAEEPGAASQPSIEPNSVAKAYGDKDIPTVKSTKPDGQWMCRSASVSLPPLAADVRLATGMRRAGLTLSERQIAVSDGSEA